MQRFYCEFLSGHFRFKVKMIGLIGRFYQYHLVHSTCYSREVTVLFFFNSQLDITLVKLHEQRGFLCFIIFTNLKE